MQKKLNLVYKLNGEFPNGLDVYDLVSSTLAFSQLIQEANKLVGDVGEIKVYVKPPTEGSFELEMGLVVATSVLNFVNSEPVASTKALLEWIGIINSGKESFLGWIKKTNGALVKKDPVTNNYYFGEGANVIQVNNPKVGRMLESVDMRREVYPAFAKQLETNQEATSFEAYLKDTSPEQKFVLDKKDTAPFKNYSLGKNNNDTEQTRTENEYLLIESIQVNSIKWKFKIGQDESFWAEIKDVEFWKNFENGNYSYTNGDVLYCEVLVTHGLKNNEPFTKRDILEVCDIIKGKEQQKLL